MSKAVVTVVGRPNVGKSSLFNRLLGRRKALVQDEPGVTRDRNYAIAEFGDREVILCDTGGFEEQGVVASGQMARLIRQQALVAIEEGDVVVFVMDIREGLTASDLDIATRLRAIDQPVVYVLNKCDHPSVEGQVLEFYRLGVDDFVLVSAEHAIGMAELEEAVAAQLPPEGEERGRVSEELANEAVLRGRRDRKREGSASKEHGGRLQFLGFDMPEEAVTGRGPQPESWDGSLGEDLEAESEQSLLGPENAPDLIPDANLDDSPLEDSWDVHYVGGVGEGPENLSTEETPLPPDFEVEEDRDFVPRIAILGRPNVGKSTLLNRLLGYKRSITSPVAGTTHDTVDAVLEHEGRRYVLIDTAGIRRRSRVVESVEKMIVGRSIRTIEAAHIVVLVLDAQEGMTEQEAKLAALAVDRGRALVLVANKWDTQPGGEGPRKQFLERLSWRFPHTQFTDTVFLSALTGKGAHKIWRAIDVANTSHRFCLGTGPLNRWARTVWNATPPPMHKHRPVRFYYVAQTGIRPPTFVFFCNQPQALRPAYRRYLQNQFRQAHPVQGAPVKLVFKDRSGG